MSEQYERPPCPPDIQLQVNSFNAMPGEFTDCPKCKGKTFIMRAVYYEDGNYWSTIASRCSCYQTYLNKKLIKASGLESVIEKYTFDKYQTVESWQRIIKDRAMAYKDGWFFIGGQSGSGKTFICTAMVGRFLDSGMSTVYMPWGSVARRLKSIINEPEYDTEIRKYKKSKVLYIDDMWKVKDINGIPNMAAVTDSDVKIAFDILNYRYINNLMTIISTEFILPEISEIDIAVGGRITEMTEENNQWFNIGRSEDKNWRMR